jgi:hypothetical protein
MGCPRDSRTARRSERPQNPTTPTVGVEHHFGVFRDRTCLSRATVSGLQAILADLVARRLEDIAIGRCVTLRVDQCAAAVLQRGEKCLLFEGSEVSA